MRLIITRPKEDAEPLARALAALGVETLIEPLLSIELDDKATPDLAGVQALLVTSANGVRAFAAISAKRDIPVFAVGDASARTAREAGFERVESASGDVEALAGLVAEKLGPDNGVLLHIAGSKVAGDLAGALGKAGYDYRRIQLYHAARAKSLSAEGLTAIKDGNVQGVVVYSPRTAESFVDLIEKADAGPSLRSMSVICLSAAVAARLDGLEWGRIIVARTPDQAALIRCIQELS